MNLNFLGFRIYIKEMMETLSSVMLTYKSTVSSTEGKVTTTYWLSFRRFDTRHLAIFLFLYALMFRHRDPAWLHGTASWICSTECPLTLTVCWEYMVLFFLRSFKHSYNNLPLHQDIKGIHNKQWGAKLRTLFEKRTSLFRWNYI